MDLARGAIPQKIAIIGAGRSGLATAKFLLNRNTSVFVSDSSPRENLEFVLAANDLAQVSHEAGGHTDRILRYNAVILSPGARSDMPILQKARNAGIPVWSEIELAYRAARCRMLAVTGSSGKSTTVSLLASVLTHAGKNSKAIGNIGVPATSVLPELEETAWPVVEVSSFQLETIDRFHPQGAAVLNLMKNHLDRYGSEQDYYNAKKRIARNLGPDDVIVLNAEDPLLSQWAEELKTQTRVVFFGDHEGPEPSVFYREGSVILRENGREEVVVSTDKMRLKGRHNYMNAAAAAALAHYAVGIPVQGIAPGLCNFAGLPHRLEYVDTKNDVSYYNDSKATTGEAVLSAVQAFDSGVHLIAGGRDKGCDFSLLNNEMKTRVDAVYLIGEAARRIARFWSGRVPIYHCETLSEAVKTAASNASSGDSVVLSPGCSSFDMFRDFEDRGEAFREIVQEIKETKGPKK